MIKKGTRLSLFLTAVLGFLSISVGHAAFQTGENGTTDSYDGQVTLRKPVCYISGSPNVYYTSIEKALEVAKGTTGSQTVYVIPGANPTIKSNCTIASGDSLILPYADDGTTHSYYSRQNQSGVTFADANASLVSKNRTSLVTVESGIVITNNGTIEVGGVLGTGVSGQRPTGHTTGQYAELLMKSNSKIQNNGTLNLSGYIKEDSSNNGSSIVNASGSSVKMPFVIYDFRGGSYSYACYKEDIMPFSNYDLPNCQVLQRYNYGAKMTGMVTIYASSWSTPDVLVLGTESDTCLFKLSSGYFTIKYTPSNVLYTTNDVIAATTNETANLTEIHSHGDIVLSNLVITLKVVISVTIDTSKMFCPLGYKFRIYIDEGTLSIANKMKFLGGSALVVGPNGTVKINSQVIAYRDYIPAITTAQSGLYPTCYTTSSIINNGTLTISGSFGGLIETSETSGVLLTSSGFSNSVSSVEALASKNSNVLASVGTPETHTETGKAFIGTDAKPASASVLEASKSFESKGDFWAEALPDISSVDIDPSTGASGANSTGSFTLTAKLSPEQNASSNVTYTWSCTSGATLSSTTGKTVTLTTPANSDTSKDKKYTVNLTVNFTKKDGTNDSRPATGTYTATKATSGGGGCFAKGTPVLMANNLYKAIEDIEVGDIIRTFSHETGQFEDQPVTFIPYHEEAVYDVLKLNFENGKQLDVLFGHGFMNAETREYEEIRYENVSEKIGNTYLFVDDDQKLYTSALVSYEIVKERTECYSLASAYNLNHILDGALCISDDIEGLYNYFELDGEWKYDEAKKQRDLELYGLLPYEDVAYFMTPEIYDVFNVKYLNVSIGKGLITMEKMEDYIRRYA